MGMAKSLGALDNILFLVFGASFIVPTIAQSYGFDASLVWVPVIFYAFWILVTGYFIPAKNFSDSLERSTIERIRGWSYILMFPITLTLNFLVIYVLPRTLLYFFASITIVSLTLIVVVALFPSRLFRKEIVCMEKADEQQIIPMLKETGSATILFSIAIILLNFEIFPVSSIYNSLFALVASVFLLAYGYYRNRLSSKFAHEIAVSLVNSGWRKKYMRKR